MRRDRLAVVLLCLAATAANAAAPAARYAPAPAPVPVPERVRSLEGIDEYRLPNGLQVLLIPDDSKATVTVNVTYHVGSRLESYGETGMAHLLEHLMFRTTGRYANVGVEISKRGMHYNGSTSVDRTNYFETFPADAEHLSWALAMEAERMTGAQVLKSDLDTEMTVVRNEMEMGENSPTNVLAEKTMAAAYQWHAYGRSTIGARADVEHVNIDHLRAFYRRYYQPDNATLIVAGRFDVAAVLRQVARDFGTLPRPARRLEATWTVEPVQDGEREVTLRRVGAPPTVLAAYHIEAAAGDDSGAFAVLASVLGDTPNGRLHKRLVEPGHAAGVLSEAMAQAEPGLLLVGVILKGGDPIDDDAAQLTAITEGLGREPVTAEELARAQQQSEKAYEQWGADPEQLCLRLSEAIGAGDWRMYFVLRDAVRDVTLERVNAVARDWLKSSNRTLGKFVPTDAPDRAPFADLVTPEKVLAAFHPRAAVAAGEAFDPSPRNIDARTRHVVLPSGLKLALLPKATRGNTVKVQIDLRFGSVAALAGLRTPAEQLPALVGRGTRAHTRSQIEDRFDALHTEWSVTGNASQASAHLATTRAHLQDALELLAEVLREPTFPAAEVEQAVHAGIAGLEALTSEPQAVASTALSRALQPYSPGDVRYLADLKDQAQALKELHAADLGPLHRRLWGADHGQIAIVGDFDADQATALVTRLFGDWTSATPFERISMPASTITGLHLAARTPDKANAFVVGALPLQLRDTDPDYLPLAVASYVLGGGMQSSRLIMRLRQQDGLSYGAGAGLSASPFEPSGVLQLGAIFAPQNRARVEGDFAEELARFVRDGITAAELKDAVDAILLNHRTEFADDGTLAGEWTRLLQDDRRFEFIAGREERLKALTVGEVNAAIRRWIDPAKIDWSVAGDFAP